MCGGLLAIESKGCEHFYHCMLVKFMAKMRFQSGVGQLHHHLQLYGEWLCFVCAMCLVKFLVYNS